MRASMRLNFLKFCSNKFNNADYGSNLRLHKNLFVDNEYAADLNETAEYHDCDEYDNELNEQHSHMHHIQSLSVPLSGLAFKL